MASRKISAFARVHAMVAGSVGLVLCGCETVQVASNSAPAAPAQIRATGSTMLVDTKCELLATGDGGFRGTCEIPCMVNALWIDIDGASPGRRCEVAPRVVTASLKRTERAHHWLGSMQGKEPEDPTRFELLVPPAGGGVAKMPYGWYALRLARLDESRMSLSIAGDRTLPPTADDLRIIRRAIELLPREEVWNKADTRQCPKGQPKLSVFCALIQATEEIAGGYHYRQPAMQAVREVVNEVGGARVDKHRLMDYNNHPDTTLAEIHAMLRMAQARLERRLR